MRPSRVDLHVHSKYSDRPTEWILRRIGAPECHTPPMAVYQTAKRRGMRFVTISDHNAIEGALEIAHLPDTFISDEITTYFPDDGCKVHVLAWNITEAQFADIQRVREDIVALRDYLHTQQIAHACAHPLYSVNDRLTLDHFEELIVLFNVFEALNGGRNRRGNDLVTSVLSTLTRATFDEMANRHGIAPVGDTPWQKGMTGGSDDHSGVFIAKGFTECPASESVEGFLGHVAARESLAGGLDGTPLSFAHSLYSIGYQYYRDRFLSRSAGGSDLMLQVMGEVFGKARGPMPLKARFSSFARRLSGRSEPAEAEFRRLVSSDLAQLFGEDWLKDDFVADPARYEALNRRTFELTSRVANQLLFQFSTRFVERLSAGSVFGSLEALSAAGPILLGTAPYLFSFAHQNRDKAFLNDVRVRFHGKDSLDSRSKKGWFTDTLSDVNGVTTLIRNVCRLAEVHEHDLTLISVAPTAPDYPGRVQNFAPVGTFTLPDYPTMTMAFPPFLDVLDYCDREQFTELVVSTPGLSGLAALAAGKMLNIPLVGIYHTDLPQYIRYYTDDEAMESAAWRYLSWFYGQMDAVMVPSRAYRQQLVAKGFDERKLRLLPHGTDTSAFHPAHRHDHFWSHRGAKGGPVVTYVGRVAKEKDLDVLIDVYQRLAAERPDATLAIVGDGPFLPQMKSALQRSNVIFTGFLFDDALSAAYASSDVFVFPSTTDTFGNVVLEAMSSGLPVVVSDRGGARELVEHQRTGLVAEGRSVNTFVDHIQYLLDRPDERVRMGVAARAHAETRGWDNLYMQFWNGRAQEIAPALAMAEADLALDRRAG